MFSNIHSLLSNKSSIRSRKIYITWNNIISNIISNSYFPISFTWNVSTRINRIRRLFCLRSFLLSLQRKKKKKRKKRKETFATNKDPFANDDDDVNVAPPVFRSACIKSTCSVARRAKTTWRIKARERGFVSPGRNNSRLVARFFETRFRALETIFLFSFLFFFFSFLFWQFTALEEPRSGRELSARLCSYNEVSKNFEPISFGLIVYKKEERERRGRIYKCLERNLFDQRWNWCWKMMKTSRYMYQ